MQYICLILILLSIFLAARLCLLHRAIRRAAGDMEEIEDQPESNRQLKTASIDCSLERLLKQINVVYRARQLERIRYKRRELQIRQEIENISHDLRTPLTSILGYLDLIEDEETTAQEREEYLGIIRRRARVLQSFIQDFYEISRIQADDYPIKRTSILVQGLVKEVIVAYYHSFEERHIQVHISLEESPCRLLADRNQLERILNNLIQNALKYARRNFSIKQFVTGDHCVLQFINDAEGISEEDLGRIFERFYTVDQSRSGQSSGLGLTIAKTLTEKLKGTIEARMEGDLFIIELKMPMKPFPDKSVS